MANRFTCRGSRAILKQHVSPSLFRPRHGGQPSNCQHSGGRSRRLTTPSRANRYINERLSLKSHLPGSVPHLCVRGKFCHLVHGGLVKGSDQRIRKNTDPYKY
ncbi:hypothetical protein TNCV_4975711 [Trichonephila clavipes]|uniref:Uncharacterized protein n=1 Tax=Trichonephila clavipes TaxID=2585209 RepID=A0A8X6SF38_TRICX|nr:hypothetical protein TNCV_4975711 [Trichonephila clavipes]